MEHSLDNRNLTMLLDVVKEKDDKDLYEEIFRMISEESYFISVVHFSKKPIPLKSGSFKLERDTDMKFLLLANNEGLKYYPAFTDYMELNKWNQDLDKNTVLTLCIDDYVELLDRDLSISGIVINAFNQSFIVSKEMLNHILKVRKENKPLDVRQTFLKGLEVKNVK